jgi:hypothetical protein
MTKMMQIKRLRHLADAFLCSVVHVQAMLYSEDKMPQNQYNALNFFLQEYFNDISTWMHAGREKCPPF